MAIFHNLLLRIFDLKIAWRFFLPLQPWSCVWRTARSGTRTKLGGWRWWSTASGDGSVPAPGTTRTPTWCVVSSTTQVRGRAGTWCQLAKQVKGRKGKCTTPESYPMLWKLWSFMSRLFCGKLQRYNILYISFVHLVCWFFRRGGVPGDVLWQRSLLPGGGEL